MNLKENNQDSLFVSGLNGRDFYQNARGTTVFYQKKTSPFSKMKAFLLPIKELCESGIYFLFLMTILSSLTGCSDFTAPPEQGWANKYNEAMRQRDLLIKKYKSVVNQYNEMVEEHNAVLGQYDRMQAEYSAVVSLNDEIVNEYNVIASRHNALMDKYNMMAKKVQSYTEQRGKDNAFLMVNYIKSVHAMNIDLMRFSLNVREFLVSDNPKNPEDYEKLKALFEKGEKSILHAQDELRELTGVLFRSVPEEPEKKELSKLLNKVKSFLNLKGVLVDHKSLWLIVEREFHGVVPVINDEDPPKISSSI